MKFWPARLIFVIISFFAYGQQSEINLLLDSARVLWYKDFNKTNQLLDLVDRYLESRNDSSSIYAKLAVLQCRVSSCQAFSRFQLWRENLERTEKFLQGYRTELGEEFSTLQLDNQLGWAIFYVEIQDDAKALPVLVRLQKAFRAFPQTSPVCHNLFLTTNYLAAIYQRRGEYKAAINQNLAGVPYYECLESDSESGYNAVIYRNVGLNFLEMGDFVNARKYLFSAERIIQKQLRKDPESITHHALALFESQADFYKKTGNPDSALISVSKALPFLSYRTVRDEFKGRISLSLADLYLDQKNFEKALYYLDKAEAYFLSGAGQLAISLAEVDLTRANLYAQQKRIDEALEYCNLSIERLTVFTPESNDRSNHKVLSNKKLFRALLEKSRLIEKLYKTNNQVSYLEEATAINQLAITLLDSTSVEFSFDEDRINLTGQSYRVFEDGIRINNLLYRLTGNEKNSKMVLWLMEQSKGVLLLENLRMVNRFSGVSEEWLSREKELKAEMLAVEKLLYEEEMNKKNERSGQLRQRLADLKNEYSRLVDQFRKQSPDYFKLRYDHTVLSPEAIQKQLLKPGEALIEFFVGDSILAVAGLSPTRMYLNVKPLPPNFTNQVNQLRSALTRSSDATFNRSASELYDFLLKDCLAELGKDVKSLIIIPDGLLGYIPFEVLMPSREENSFLNDRYAVHYAHSATYLTEQLQRKPPESKYFFAGFVASGNPEQGVKQATRDRQLAVLKGAEREVVFITKLISSKFNIFNPAGKTDFINHAPDYQVLHLAMHSVVNDVNPMMSEMIFARADSSEQSLTAGELYGMQFNSQLAVLSACNTGMGQLHRGEGIMSFSRAFAYAGVPAAVISLWKVPDEATSKIMVGFYRHLKDGEPKDRALQLARQEFIRDNPEYFHPYFWSGFILTGTADPIEFPPAFQWYWFITGLLVIVAFGFTLRKRLMPGRFLSGSS